MRGMLMAKRGKRTTTTTPQSGEPGARIVSEEGNLPARASAADYVRRRAEVDARDHQEFQGYLAEKKEADARKAVALMPPPKKWGFSRRSIFNAAVGTAVVAEAGVLGYNALNGAASGNGVGAAGAVSTAPQSG